MIPCFNNLPGMIRSVQSIRYTEGKYAVILVDDGSTPPLMLPELKLALSPAVPLHLISLGENSGITGALNAGLRWILHNLQTRYIARLDCGDVCHADRFFRQVAYLDAHQDVGLLGSWCTFKQTYSSFQYNYTTPTEHNLIQREMYFRNVFIHPTVIFRSTLLNKVGLYPEAFQYVEDYALFWKILQESKGKILDELLVTCEINKAGISIKNRKAQLQGRKHVIKAFGESFFLKFLGEVKLIILGMIPYHMVMHLKEKFTRTGIAFI
nr:glycosyltransferase [Pontibacter liquoris]